MRYLFDSDVLIAAKNLHYKPAFASHFWDWIEAGHKAGLFFSIDKVRDELLNGDNNDPLYKWAQSAPLAGYFLPSQHAIGNWSALSLWATHKDRQYLAAAKTKFLNPKSADAWLIAYAGNAGDCTIITNEVPAPDSKKDIKLPDAAAAMGVPTITLTEVLTKHATGNFTFKK